MLKTVQNIVYESTGRTNITLQTDFIKDLNLTSFDIVNIMVAFEERYDIEIPNRDLWDMRTVSDVIAYMERRGLA